MLVNRSLAVSPRLSKCAETPLPRLCIPSQVELLSSQVCSESTVWLDYDSMKTQPAMSC